MRSSASLLWLALFSLLASCSGGGGSGGGSGQAPVPLPSNILTVGPGEMFNSIAAALAQVDATHNVIRVDPGVYGPFTIDPQGNADYEVHILGSESGQVTIDTTASPISINNLLLFNDVELRNLAITNSSSTHASLVLQHARPSVLVLDELQISPGVGQPTVEIQDSWRIAFQRSVISGPQGLRITGFSIVTASSTQIDHLEVLDTSFVRGMELTTGTVTVDPSATYTTFPGLMPDLTNSEIVSLGTPVSLFLQGEPGQQWFIGLSTSLDWYETPMGRFPLVGLIDAFHTEVLFMGTYDASGMAQQTFVLPTTVGIAGKVLTFQGLQFDPVMDTYRWTSVTTMIGL